MEILISVAIFSVVLLGVYTILGAAQKSRISTEADLELQREADHIRRRIQKALSDVREVTFAGTDGFAFLDAEGTSHAVSFSTTSGAGVLRLDDRPISMFPLSNVRFFYQGYDDRLDRNADGEISEEELDTNRDGILSGAELSRIGLVKFKARLEHRGGGLDLSLAFKVWQR